MPCLRGPRGGLGWGLPGSIALPLAKGLKEFGNGWLTIRWRPLRLLQRGHRDSDNTFHRPLLKSLFPCPSSNFQIMQTIIDSDRGEDGLGSNSRPADRKDKVRLLPEPKAAPLPYG